MGAWGAKVFENDDAMDFLGSVSSETSVEKLLRPIKAVSQLNDQDYLEAPQASEALAAIGVVVAAVNRDFSLPEGYESLSDFLAGKIDNQTVELSLKVLQRISTNSELKDLWIESNEYGEWKDCLEDMKRKLGD